jgi:hypothetical protein
MKTLALVVLAILVGCAGQPVAPSEPQDAPKPAINGWYPPAPRPLFRHENMERRDSAEHPAYLGSLKENISPAGLVSPHKAASPEKPAAAPSSSDVPSAPVPAASAAPALEGVPKEGGTSMSLALIIVVLNVAFYLFGVATASHIVALHDSLKAKVAGKTAGVFDYVLYGLGLFILMFTGHPQPPAPPKV